MADDREKISTGPNAEPVDENIAGTAPGIPDDALEEFVKVGAQAGYKFTGEEFQAAMDIFDQDYRTTSSGGSDDTIIL